MSAVMSSQLFGDPHAVSATMPGVYSKFVELPSGVVAGVYHGDGHHASQASMVNDLGYIWFSCILAGKVETHVGKQPMIPEVGCSHMGFSPNIPFVIKANAHFKQVELLIPPEQLLALIGDEFEWVETFLKQGAFFCQSASSQQSVHAAMKLAERVEQDQAQPLLMQAAVLEFLAWNLGGTMTPKSAGPDEYRVPLRERRQLMVARDYLLADLSQAPTIAQLAKESGLNQLKLKKGFRQLFGNSVYALFQSERMQQARRLLRQHNVGETAHRLGYSNTSHFIKVFSKHFGITPGQARLDDF